ncbi:MAG TPA: DegQ family serine endoprotease [Steroidobacteraceae bacterium]
MTRIQLHAVSVLSALLLSMATAQAALPAQVGETPVPSLAPMIKKVSPTVVNIATRGTVQDRGRNPLLEDPFFRRFFDVPPDLGPRQLQSAGSGVVVDAKNGYIITNAHVVENATEITVTTHDNRNFTAKVVGADTGSDVAVLKLNEQNGKMALLPSIPLGDSSKVEVGDFVVAIGNPFALQHTVTSGIISALGRSGINPDGYEDFIQTDAAINPGNSGGALVNLRGELVGINSAILSRTGGNIGIGFAIPVNMVKSVMNQLIEYGEVKRGLLGVNIYTLTPDLVQAAGAPADIQGALVSQVAEGSSADKAGIKVNDIITSVNGQLVKGAPELRNAIGLLRIGDKVEIGLVREGKPRKVTAAIGERSDVTTAAADVHPALEGAELADADNQAGVVVQSVEAGSRAAQAGLRANDIISGVNRSRVTTAAELREAAAGQSVLLLSIRRGNTPLLLQIR